MLLDTIALKTPKSREKTEYRRYFDYCRITATEYNWKTKNPSTHKNLQNHGVSDRQTYLHNIINTKYNTIESSVGESEIPGIFEI
jgi:hypothetical protein